MRKLKESNKEEKPITETVKVRKTKYSDKITEEDLNNLDDGIQTPADIAETRQVPTSAVTNKQTRRKEKLKVNLINKTADTNLPDIKQTTDSYETPQDTQLNGIPLDAIEALKGMWQFVDTMLQMLNTLAKGRIEYTKLSDEELTRLATVCNQSPFMRKVATQEGLSGLIIVGTVVGTFGSHLKFNLQKKHKENDPSCECKECKIKLLEEELKKEEVKIQMNEKNNVPDVVNQKTPEEVIAQNTSSADKEVPDYSLDSKDFLREKVINGSDATDEYQLPEDGK